MKFGDEKFWDIQVYLSPRLIPTFFQDFDPNDELGSKRRRFGPANLRGSGSYSRASLLPNPQWLA
jgi:hypothetical protein